MNQQVLSHHVLNQRSDVHWARKILHMGMVFLMFLVWTMAPEKVSVGMLIVGWLAFVPLDFLRQRNKVLNDWLFYAFRPIMRQHELNRIAGTTYLIFGVGTVVLLFPRPIVSLTLLFLAFADPIASFVGIRYGRDKIFKHKSLQGTIAAYVVCTIASFGYVLAMNQPVDRTIVFSLVAGAVGALAELVPVANLDDNFTLPVFSAMGLSALFYFFGFWS